MLCVSFASRSCSFEDVAHDHKRNKSKCGGEAIVLYLMLDRAMAVGDQDVMLIALPRCECPADDTVHHVRRQRLATCLGVHPNTVQFLHAAET